MKPKMTMLLFVLAALLGASTAAAFDQLPPGKWWEVPKVVEELALTTEQQEKIHAMVYEHALGMIDLNAAVRRSELELANLVEQPGFDADEVRRAFAVFQRSRQDLENSRFEMLLSVREILSTDQWKKLQDMRQRFEKNRGPRRGERGDRPPMGHGGDRRPQGPPR